MLTFRGFIAIDVDASKELIEFMNDLKKISARLKLVETKNIHLTLKFLGNTREDAVDEIADCIRKASKGIEPFSFRLKGVGVFPNMKRINVIWVGIEDGNEIVTIANRLEEELHRLGYKKERREFSPHVTVARVKSVENKNELISTLEKYANRTFGKVIVSSIKLKKSELTPKGPIYTTLRDINLG
ncbi:MAG TPA: RNA 2',3'-cyclic phosphodiesterase [Thermoplasmatales archaeon]|nr:RNA 2',3'-cyclic phosphodiesterase [Thermoplasmatales archaeon]